MRTSKLEYIYLYHSIVFVVVVGHWPERKKKQQNNKNYWIQISVYYLFLSVCVFFVEIILSFSTNTHTVTHNKKYLSSDSILRFFFFFSSSFYFSFTGFFLLASRSPHVKIYYHFFFISSMCSSSSASLYIRIIPRSQIECILSNLSISFFFATSFFPFSTLLIPLSSRF